MGARFSRRDFVRRAKGPVSAPKLQRTVPHEGQWHLSSQALEAAPTR